MLALCKCLLYFYSCYNPKQIVLTNAAQIILQHIPVLKMLKAKMYLNFKIMYLGDLNGLKYTKRDKYLFGVLLVGGKKALTRKWLKRDKPTINEWMDIIYNIIYT